MNREWLLSYIGDLRQGMQGEDLKIDRKREWWKLRTPDGDQEYARDACAIANTRGTGDGALIVGVDKGGVLKSCPLSEIGIDKVELQQIIRKRCEPPFEVCPDEYDVDGCIITVISIPRSRKRPHVMGIFKNRENYIPVRKSTGSFPANRYDIDEMYADRSPETEEAPEAVIEDKVLRMYLERQGSSWPRGFYLCPSLRLRNPAKVSCSIEKVELRLEPSTESHAFESVTANLHGVAPSGQAYRHTPILMQAGESILGVAYFALEERYARIVGNIRHAECKWEVTLHDSRRHSRASVGGGQVMGA